MAHLSNAETANISTYILQSWCNSGPTVTEQQVQAIREGSGTLDRAAGQAHQTATDAQVPVLSEPGRSLGISVAVHW